MAGRRGWTAWVAPEKRAARLELASLREDYLNQVQRDFLSRALRRNTPSGFTLRVK